MTDGPVMYQSEHSGKWGDAFAARIPKWVELIVHSCSCKNVQRKMNNCSESEARALFGSFVEAVAKNGERSAVLRMVPKAKLTSAIERRMKLAFKDAYGSDL